MRTWAKTLFIQKQVQGNNEAHNDVDNAGGEAHGPLKELGHQGGQVGGEGLHPGFRRPQDFVYGPLRQACQVIFLRKVCHHGFQLGQPGRNLLGQACDALGDLGDDDAEKDCQQNDSCDIGSQRPKPSGPFPADFPFPGFEDPAFIGV